MTNINLLAVKLIWVSLALTLAITANANAASWGYGTNNGPQHWPKEFPECGMGKNQSPIDIVDAIEADLPKLGVSYHGQVALLENNGHTIEARVSGKNHLLLNQQQFQLKQFHFHTPSENKIAGKQFPMEMHFVHANLKGQLAVVAVMFDEIKQDNPVLGQLFKQLPQNGQVSAINTPINVAYLLPKDHDYYRFNGSLTTPPCSEGVSWFVLQQPLSASAAQIAKIHEIIGNNNRPLQEINARIIVED